MIQASLGMVYLAGPIANVSGAQAVDWRDDATTFLQNHGFRVRNPMRSKHAALGPMAKISNNFNDYKDYGTFFKSRAIMARDFNDVKQSDGILVNLLGATQPSLGTIMEMAWAYAMQKPCVVMIEATGNPHDNHPMIHEAMSFRVENFDDGLYAIYTILR